MQQFQAIARLVQKQEYGSIGGIFSKFRSDDAAKGVETFSHVARFGVQIITMRGSQAQHPSKLMHSRSCSVFGWFKKTLTPFGYKISTGSDMNFRTGKSTCKKPPLAGSISASFFFLTQYKKVGNLIPCWEVKAFIESPLIRYCSTSENIFSFLSIIQILRTKLNAARRGENMGLLERIPFTACSISLYSGPSLTICILLLLI